MAAIAAVAAGVRAKTDATWVPRAMRRVRAAHQPSSAAASTPQGSLTQNPS